VLVLACSWASPWVPLSAPACREQHGAVGLVNLGDTGFVNVVLQALFAVAPVRETFTRLSALPPLPLMSAISSCFCAMERVSCVPPRRVHRNNNAYARCYHSISPILLATDLECRAYSINVEPAGWSCWLYGRTDIRPRAVTSCASLSLMSGWQHAHAHSLMSRL
jgi:hypothetical protein